MIPQTINVIHDMSASAPLHDNLVTTFSGDLCMLGSNLTSSLYSIMGFSMVLSQILPGFTLLLKIIWFTSVVPFVPLTLGVFNRLSANFNFKVSASTPLCTCSFSLGDVDPLMCTLAKAVVNVLAGTLIILLANISFSRCILFNLLISAI